MNDPIDQAFEVEQHLYEANLQKIRGMEFDEQDTALRTEKRRHMWAICSIWRGRGMAAPPLNGTGN